MITHRGGCHCGRVRFEVEAPARLQVIDCNCSMCAKSGYLHLIVPKERFKLLSGAEALTAYEFNTRTAKHLFCSVCGVKSFYVPASARSRRRNGRHRPDRGGQRVPRPKAGACSRSSRCRAAASLACISPATPALWYPSRRIGVTSRLISADAANATLFRKGWVHR